MASTLTNTTNFPNGGYAYREPSIRFHALPNSSLAMQGIAAVAEALRMARLQNPASGLNPDYDECVEAVKRYTCARLNNDPRFCSSTEQTVKQVVVAKKVARKRCKTCGSRR